MGGVGGVVTASGRPRLQVVAAPRRPEGVVLLLHGGGGGPGAAAVSATQPSVLRMVPVAWRVAAAGRRRLVVARVLNAFRGWHPDRTPVEDAHWALDVLARRFGDLPSCLVGHSLGGRAALLSAVDRPRVSGVVLLAPWLHADDGVGLRGRRVLLVHGDRDAVASPRRALAVAGTLAARNEVGVVRLAEAGHTLVREHAVVDALTADFARTVLLDAPPRTSVLRRVADGEDVVRV